MGVRMSRSRGLAAPDGVRGLRLGPEPAREGTYCNLRPPRPTCHSQRRRHPPRREYALRRAAHRSAGRARPYAGDAQRARAGPLWLRARAVLARASDLGGGDEKRQVSLINTRCTACAAGRVYLLCAPRSCLFRGVGLMGLWSCSKHGFLLVGCLTLYPWLA